MVIAVVAVLLANMADSGSRPHARAPKGSSTSTTAPSALRLVLGPVNMQNVGPPARVQRPLRRVLLAAAQSYVDDAILTPLKTGRVDNRYERIFDAAVRGAASGHDRTILTEEATGVARGPVRATASPVVLDGLGDQNGKPALIATTFVLTIHTPLAKGLLTIRRLTELTFTNEFGHWLVLAYNVGVRRTIGATTTSSNASTPGGLRRLGVAA